MKLSNKISKILFFIILGLSLNAYSEIIDLLVKENLDVYQKPSTNSKKISTLTRGDKVVLSPVGYGEFRKVLVTYKGKRVGGYILAKNIRLSKEISRGDSGDNLLKRSKSFTFSLDFTYNTQFEKDLQINGYSDATIGTQKGVSNTFSLGYQHPFRQNFVFQYKLTKLKLVWDGSGDLNVSTTGVGIETKIDGWALGANMKYYSNIDSIFWWKLGADVVSIQSIELTADNGVNIVDASEISSLFNLSLGIGWDAEYSHNFFIVPEIYTNFYFGADKMPMQIGAALTLSWIY